MGVTGCKLRPNRVEGKGSRGLKIFLPYAREVYAGLGSGVRPASILSASASKKSQVPLFSSTVTENGNNYQTLNILSVRGV